MFVVNSPDVYKSPNAETYIIFGTAQEASDDVSQLQAAQLAEQLQAGNFGAAPSGASVEEVKEPAADAADEAGLNAKDIELVMSQGNVDRATAVKALKKTGGDMVTAIMVRLFVAFRGDAFPPVALKSFLIPNLFTLLFLALLCIRLSPPCGPTVARSGHIYPFTPLHS